METRVMTAHVPVELAERVDALAEQMDRSRGWIIKQALATWVEREEERERLILEALAEVDAGNVVDDEVMQEWFDSVASRRASPASRL